MNWTESTNHLPPPDMERLLNALTVGVGHATLAQRRITQNGLTAEIARSLLQAHHSLRSVQAALDPDPGGRPDPTVLLHPHEHWHPPARWAEFLAELAPEAAHRLLAAHQEAVRAARAIIESMMPSGERRVTDQQIAVAVSALGRVRQHLIDGSEPRSSHNPLA